MKQCNGAGEGESQLEISSKKRSVSRLVYDCRSKKSIDKLASLIGSSEGSFYMNLGIRTCTRTMNFICSTVPLSKFHKDR